jgi:hypothetical protein
VREQRSASPLPTEPALDRSPQTLPVPLGGLSPARRQSSALAWWWRRHQPTALTVIAIASIGVAVWVSTSPRSFSVVVRGGDVSVDGEILTPAVQEPANGVRVFTGRGSVAIGAASSGTTRSGAVMTWNGLAMTGQCVLHVTGANASEACEFTTEGGARVTSVDNFDFDARVWHRRYQDGMDVTIAVPAGTELIPIPFPLGR